MAQAWLGQALPEGPARAARIRDLYLPLLEWSLESFAGRRSTTLALSGPQGCGKSTLAAHLVALLGALGRKATAISIDDFYLRHADQTRLAAAHPGNRFLEHRGAPGTHDVALGARTLDALRALGSGESLRVPAYDKSAHGGRGDRLPESEWPERWGPFDLVIVEGWLLGFQPVAAAELTDPQLGAVNALLQGYQEWTRRIDGGMFLRATDPEHIVRWRVEAEAARAASGRAALDAAAAEDYIRRYLPLYALYGRAAPPWAHSRLLWLGPDRLPLSVPR